MTPEEIHFCNWKPSKVERLAYEWIYNRNTKEVFNTLKPEFEGKRVWEIARLIWLKEKEEEKILKDQSKGE